MYGGSWIVDADGVGCASVAFDEEGVIVADVTPGPRGGDPESPLFRDPGLVHGLERLLLVDYGNLRPAAPQV
jgi:hypothetical protein